MVADLLQPFNVFAVQRFLHRGVRHRRGGRRAMPMLLARRKPDDVAGAYLLDRSAFALDPAEAGRDDQGLAERMGVPGGARTRLECHAGGADPRRFGRLKQRIEPNDAGEIFGRRPRWMAGSRFV